MREAAACGAGAALIVGGGFGETGTAEGKARQAEILSICRTSGIRLLGPNTAGFGNLSRDIAASFWAGLNALPKGNISVVAQSSGVSIIIATQLQKLGYGVNLSVGLGNSIDVTPADVIDYLADDDNTAAIALHFEGIADGRHLCEAIRHAVPRKPVVALTIGRTDIGTFARSHTGNMVGSYALKRAALRQAGAVVADSTNDLVDAVIALSQARIAPRRDPGVGMVTGQGGAGLLMLDELRANGVAVPAFAPETLATIRALLPPMTYMRNPVDTARPGASFGKVLAAVADDPGVDAVVGLRAARGRHRHRRPGRCRESGLRETPDRRQRRLCRRSGCGILPALRRLGVPAYASPERAAKAMTRPGGGCARASCSPAAGGSGRATACARAGPRRAGPRRAGPRRAGPRPLAPVALGPAALAPAALASVALGPGALDEAAAKALLRRYGLRVPLGVVCATRQAALDALATLPLPVVVKVLNPAIVHKTDVGGVFLNVRTATELTAALDAIDRIPAPVPSQYLIEETAQPGVELIVGGLNDASFGPTVMVGMGGVLAQAIKDTALRLAPLGRDDALEMLASLKSAVVLDGWRGAPPVDKAALADAIVGVGRMMAEHPEIAELDINPLRALTDGCVALDAVVVT